jgi:predicted phage-related endonuclease
MKFEYFAGQQRTPEWFELRRGKVTASRLDDWLSVSKAKTGMGKPLKKRLDYEKELLFERQFGVSYENFVSAAMQDGIDFEVFARQQYEKITGNVVREVGCWYNDLFVASPDGAVDPYEIKNDSYYEGLIEIKVLKDNSFTDVLTDGVPEKHWRQIQGQLWAAGSKWCDYVAINLNTKKMKIIRVEADTEFQEYLELSLNESLVVAEFDGDQLFDFVDALPEGVAHPMIERDFSDSNTSGGIWND